MKHILTVILSASLYYSVSMNVNAQSSSHPDFPTNSSWRVENLDEGGLVDNSMITIVFTEEGGVSGASGCNRYFGQVEIDDYNIVFSKLGSSMMACAQTLMAQEKRFFEALQAVKHFNITGGSVLVLSDAQARPRIRAVKVAEEPQSRPVPIDLPPTTSIEFDCSAEDKDRASMRFLGPNTIELRFAGQTYILQQESTASGAKYVSQGVSFWNKGDEAMIEIHGKHYTCRRVDSTS
jgi:putative lipoprotein